MCMWLSLVVPNTKCSSVKIALQACSSEFPKAKGSSCRSLTFVEDQTLSVLKTECADENEPFSVIMPAFICNAYFMFSCLYQLNFSIFKNLYIFP